MSSMHRPRAERPVAIVTGVLTVLMYGSFVAPARADATCSWAGGVVSAVITGVNGAARMLVGTGDADGKILFAAGDATPTPCGAATVANTDSVTVNGAAERQSFRLSIAAGAMGPGAIVEPTGASEIEFSVDLGSGTDQVVVAAGSDPDHLVAGSDGVNLNANEAPDDVDILLEGVEQLALEGGSGADTISGAGGEGTGAAVALALSLRGGAGDDVITGGLGPDVLNGGDGRDALDGGDGTDTASYFGAPSGVVVSLTDGTASGGYGIDSLVGIENLAGSAFDDVLTGDDSDNALMGMGGADALSGMGGTDAARYTLAEAGVIVELASGTATGGAGNDTLSDIENVLGSAFDDVLAGDDGDNHLFGGDGNDLLAGRGGRDLLQGGDGDDRIRGGSENDGLIGQGGADTLRGGGQNDGLRGGAGDDTLRGGPGNDALRGGAATDSCRGGAGIDRVRSCEG